MPNYVYHRIVMRGPEATIDAIRDKHFCDIKNWKGEAEDYCFDLSSIIPMPPELEACNTGGVGILHEIFYEMIANKPYPHRKWDWQSGGSRMNDKMHSLADIKGWLIRKRANASGGYDEPLSDEEQAIFDATSVADIVAIYDAKEPEELSINPREKSLVMRWTDLGRLEAEAVKICGWADSLNFCTEVWGTKWGTFRCGVDVHALGTLEFHFESAWNPPTPCLHKLAEMYPDIRFQGMAYDEGANFEASIVAMEGVCAVEKMKPARDATYEWIRKKKIEREEEEEEDAA